MIQSKILIVDDEPGMITSLKDLLDLFGHQVDTANNGYEALARVKETHYSVVLMDVRMPGINGVETLKEITKIDPNCVVIMMTAYSMDDLLSEAIDEGAISVFYKPLDITKLVGAIEDIEQSKLILVVDDDPLMRRSLLDNLVYHGFHVITASDGAEAIEKIRESDVGVVLLDVLLPGMNGLDVYLKLREIRPGVKVVLITGQQHVETIVSQAIDASVYACLYKPFDVGLLVDVIHSLIRGTTKTEIQSIIDMKSN